MADDHPLPESSSKAGLMERFSQLESSRKLLLAGGLGGGALLIICAGCCGIFGIIGAQITAKERAEIAEAGRLWERGDSSAAVAQYKAILHDYSPVTDATPYERIIQFELDATNNDEANKYAEMAVENVFGFSSKKANVQQLIDEIRSQRQSAPYETDIDAEEASSLQQMTADEAYEAGLANGETYARKGVNGIKRHPAGKNGILARTYKGMMRNAEANVAHFLESGASPDSAIVRGEQGFVDGMRKVYQEEGVYFMLE